MRDLDLSHPAIADLARAARARVPSFVWAYLDSGTGDDRAAQRNRDALDAVCLLPQVLAGLPEPDLSTTLMGERYPLPFGIAPVGMTGLMRRGGEVILARTAAEAGIPVGLSTVAAATPEEVGPEAGGQGWFQLYPPRDPEIRRDLLARAWGAGFRTLVLTADVPIASRRERQRRARLTNPMRITPRAVIQTMLAPHWALQILQHGIPRLKTLEPYTEVGTARPGTAHAGYLLRTAPDWDYLAALRHEWQGKLVVKGVLDPAAAARMPAAGVDAVWVSNHGGRQFDAAPASLDALAPVKDAAGGLPVIWDGGVRSGTDVLRALAKGADFVMLGRAFQYGLAAFGAEGAAHVVHILRDGMVADMGQLGLARLEDLPTRLAP